MQIWQPLSLHWFYGSLERGQ